MRKHSELGERGIYARCKVEHTADRHENGTIERYAEVRRARCIRNWRLFLENARLIVKPSLF